MTTEETKAVGTGESAEKPTKKCRTCERWKEMKRQIGLAEVLGSAVQKLEKKFEETDFKPTISEFLKLVQVEQEYERELNPPEEIQVTWVEPTAESENSK